MALCVVVAVVAAAPLPARATVQEPNGINVPAPPLANGCASVTCTGGRICSDGRCEMPLQGYFTNQGETIDSHADASVEPGAFLPLCDFAATLVLSESQAAAGIAWYNQPAADTGPPTVWYPIGPAMLTVGQTITSSDIRTNANYAGGLVGFALIKQLNNKATAVYYTEYQRNVRCTGCTMPGYWKMALAYRSKDPNSYYVAFEDWEGADQNSWLGNDGDFNDKVFKFSGVTCEGGGEPCDTKMLGICADGVTQCQVGAALMCIPRTKAKTETCNNLDDDCNGMVDDNATCDTPGWVCDRGTCVHPCDNSSEFKCVPGLQCDQGLCKDPRCIGVTCTTGKICLGGTCVGGCDGVHCPLGQECRLGVCVDPCAGVSCPGAVCEDGACVTSCGCHVCKVGKTCASDGRCVDDGCEKLTCNAGFVCVHGTCQDGCTDAVCPGNAACHGGVCDPPMPVVPTGAAGTSGSAGTTGTAGTTGASGTSGRGGTTGTGGTAGSAGASGGTTATGTAGSGPAGRGGTVGCACASADGATGSGLALCLLLAVAATCRRRARGSD